MESLFCSSIWAYAFVADFLSVDWIDLLKLIIIKVILAISFMINIFMLVVVVPLPEAVLEDEET